MDASKVTYSGHADSAASDALAARGHLNDFVPQTSRIDTSVCIALVAPLLSWQCLPSLLMILANMSRSQPKLAHGTRETGKSPSQANQRRT